jgi:hypothetical protein
LATALSKQRVAANIPLVPERPESVVMDPEVQRTLAADLFNYCWTLIEKEDRTARETDRMIDAAHASRFFWEQIGEPVHHARGEWQISRAYAVAGRAEQSLYHAAQSLAICEANGIGDFDLAYAYEAMARAHAVVGDRREAKRWAAKARSAAAEIADPDDRELLLNDIGELESL